MVKTTVNLDTEIYRTLVAEAVEKYGTTKTLSRIINEKLRSRASNGKRDVVADSFGIWKLKETGSEYTRRIRLESEKRLKGILHE